MTAATILRPLAPSEQVFAFSEVFVGYSVRVAGRVDLAALDAAFEALVTAHPVLGAQLVPYEPHGHTLVTAGPPEIVCTVAEGDPENLLTGAEPEQRRALGSLHVVRGGDRTGITLLVHHSIADARHALALLRRLLTCYATAATGRVPLLPPAPIPKPVEELLTARGIRRLPIAGTDRPARTEPPPPPPEAFRAELGSYPTLVTTRCLLSRAVTAGLVDYGHREGVSVHGLVAAALLLTEARARCRPVHELLCSYSVDLRRRVAPPIGALEGSNVLGFTGYRPVDGTAPTPVALARGVCGALAAGLGSGRIQQTPLQLPDTLALPPADPFDVVMTTNWGRIPDLPLPGLRLDDFRSTMIAKPDPTHRRPPQPGGGTTIVSTFGGQLSIEVHHPPEFTPVQRPRIACLEDLLGRLGTGH